MGRGLVSPLGQHFYGTERWLVCPPSPPFPARGPQGWPAPQTFTLARSPQGSFKELVYVFFMLKDAGFAPDLLSYAAALQCMGRLDRDASTIQRWVARQGQRGVSVPGRVAARC